MKMDKLKELLVMPGFKNIATYIQSGNVIFDHSETDKNVLINKIEAKLLKGLGYEVKTLLRTIPELEAIIKNTPFKKHADDMRQHVSFLSVVPDATASKALLEQQTEFEQFRFAGTEVYILVKKGEYGETKFSNTFLEKKLKLAATTRNWETVNKMVTFAE